LEYDAGNGAAGQDKGWLLVQSKSRGRDLMTLSPSISAVAKGTNKTREHQILN